MITQAENARFNLINTDDQLRALFVQGLLESLSCLSRMPIEQLEQVINAEKVSGTKIADRKLALDSLRAFLKIKPVIDRQFSRINERWDKADKGTKKKKIIPIA